MDSYTISHIQNDTLIDGLGSLFRRNGLVHWGINVDFDPEQDRTSVKISNAPLLIRKEIINPTVNTKLYGWEQTLTILNTANWEIATIADCPGLERQKISEGKQFCFVFKIKDGKTVYLPQFELARALFFRNAYLSTAALEPEYLKSEFDVSIDNENDKAYINVLPSSSFPIKSYNESKVRRVLSWILLDEEARKSYESIGKYLKLNGKDHGVYRYWDFQFEPPLLPFAELNVRGRFIKKSDVLLITKIDGIRNLSADIPNDIEIYHPKFKEQVRGKGINQLKTGTKRPDEHVIHDDEDVNSDIQQVIIQTSMVDVEFSKPFETKQAAKKKRSSKVGKLDESEAKEASKDVSTEEGTAGQGLPGADWDGINDETDDSHLYETKFSSFLKMLEILVSKHNCIISSRNMRRLPQMPRCTKHLLVSDGNPRSIAVVEIQVNGKEFHILEVDTSDAEKSLSTQLLCLKSKFDWDKTLKIIEQELVRKSLCWPKNKIKNVCIDDGNQGIPHPRTGSKNKGLLALDSIECWADRFYAWMVSV